MEEEEFVIRQKLEQHGFSEIRRLIMSFSGWRKGKDGHPREVWIEIWDLGHKGGDQRYHVEAKSGDGKSATGNGAPDVETAIAITHWQNFDPG